MIQFPILTGWSYRPLCLVEGGARELDRAAQPRVEGMETPKSQGGVHSPDTAPGESAGDEISPSNIETCGEVGHAADYASDQGTAKPVARDSNKGGENVDRSASARLSGQVLGAQPPCVEGGNTDSLAGPAPFTAGGVSDAQTLGSAVEFGTLQFIEGEG